MGNVKNLVIIAVIAMIGMVQVGLAYPQNWEGSIVTKSYSAGEQSWWLKGYLLQGGYKHQIMDSESFWKIYNSNGKRYYGTTGDSLDITIDSIPSGREIRFTSIMDNPVSTPVPVPKVVSTATTPILKSQVSNPDSWKPLQGESCWSSGSNLGRCTGKSVGGFVKAFVGGFMNS